MSESADQTPEKKLPKLIPQPHGGAILSGGVPGNKGGGRPPNKVRAAARKAFDERIKVLAEIADDDEEKGENRIRALDTLARVGLTRDADAVPMKTLLEGLTDTWQALQQFIPTSKMEDAAGVWLAKLQEHFGD